MVGCEIHKWYGCFELLWVCDVLEEGNRYMMFEIRYEQHRKLFDLTVYFHHVSDRKMDDSWLVCFGFNGIGRWWFCGSRKDRFRIVWRCELYFMDDWERRAVFRSNSIWAIQLINGLDSVSWADFFCGLTLSPDFWIVANLRWYLVAMNSTQLFQTWEQVLYICFIWSKE